MSPSLLQLWSLRWKYLEYLLFTVFCAIILLLIVTNPGDQPLADNTLSPAAQRNMNIWIWTVGCLLICNDFRVQTCSNIDLQKSNCLEVYFVSMKAKGWYNWSLLPGIITSSHPQTCNYEFETLWVTTMKPHLNTTMQNSTNKFNLLLQFCRHEPSPPNPGDYCIDKRTCFRQKLLNDKILILNDHI